MGTNEVDINIRVNDKASAKIKGVNKELTNTGKAGNTASAGIGKMLGPIAAAIVSFQTLKRAITGIGDAIKLFANFDDTMRKVQAVTKASDSQMKTMTDTAKRLGETTRYSASQAAEALTFLGMAGFTAEEATAALSDVLNLAAAGGLDLGQAADIATNILSGFGLEVEQLSRVNDVLAEAFTGSNTTLTELGEGFKYVGPIAKGVGANFEDLIASMGKLGDAGIKGSLAGTTLRGVIDALFNPTREEALLMKELSDRIGGVGLQIRDSSGNFIGFRKLVEQLEKAGLKGEEALKLFGARAGPGMAALLNVGSASLEEFTKDLETVDNTTGKIKDTMEGGLGGALRGLKSAAEGTGLQLGESFGAGLVESINTLTFTFRRLTAEIKNLDESGIITKITNSINALVKTFSIGLDLGISQIKSFGTTFGVAWDVINGRFDEAKKRITDFQKSYREIFQSRDLLASDELIKLDLVDKKIAGYQKQIQLIEGAAKNSTRGMSKAQQSLIDNAKAQIASLTIERQKLAEAYQDTLTFDIAGEVAKAQQTGGPIGTGTDKVDPNKKIADMAKAAAEARAKAERESNLTSAKLTADLQVQRAELESLYQTDSISLMEYYEGRRKIIESAANEELRILEEKSLKTQENTDDAAKIDAKIYASKQKLNAELIRLDTEYYNAVVKNEENILKTQLENAKARELAEQAITDIQSRVDAGGERNLEVEFMRELADLQERQNKELEIISKSKDKEIQLEKYKALQKKEIDQLSFDHHKRLMEARLTLAKEITSGTVQAFTDLYYLTGEKQKEFFYIAKAAALAETTINTAQGISKAWAQGGIYGAIGAALVAVQGAIQVAKITSTGLAEGGIVPGYSPSSKSDNIPARLTAGEYVQPVDVVKHYGLGAMEALRNKVIPRDVFSNMSARLSSIPRLNYAEGGPVVAPISDSNNASGNRDNITIINYTDRQELLSALGTKDGVNAVINVISGNREKVSRVLR